MDFQSTEEFRQEIIALTAEWQTRLRLNDWNITIAIMDGEDPGFFADSQSNLAYQAAHLRFRHPRLHPAQEDTAACIDTEATVVHELLHVRSNNLPEEAHTALQKDLDRWECFIELTAQAMVAAKRGETRLGYAPAAV